MPFSWLLPSERRNARMCDKCKEIDEKIEHYQKLLLGIGDQLTVARIKSLITDLRAQKTALHPEQRR